MALYFFLMAGSIWWVMLTVTWFLSAGLKWGQEAIDVKSQVFHTIAWTLPSIMTIVVLIMKKVEGDVLSGVCFVGLWDTDSLLGFVIVPLVFYLATGSVILLFGFVSLLKIRTVMKMDGTKTDKLERLILRIGLFSILYILPATVLVVCYCYEYAHLPTWTQMWQEDICRDSVFKNKWQTHCRLSDDERPKAPSPDLRLFLAKYSAILVIGTISGFWVWCGKTLDTWRNFFLRITGSRRRPEAYV